MMPAAEVHIVMDACSHAGCRVWLDGGWAVDAVLGEQTREHDDLDLVGQLDEVDAIAKALQPYGYWLTVDERPARVVFDAGDDRSVDLHTVEIDEGGGGLQRLLQGWTFRYPPEGFGGKGTIEGREYPCLTPEVQVLCHLGYDPGEKDRSDVRLLCEKFGLERPNAYR